MLLVLWVGLRRPLAFGHPVPLRVQFDDWIREHSALSTQRNSIHQKLNGVEFDDLGSIEK